MKKIKSTMKGGNFVGSDGTPLAGQDGVKGLLERCWNWTEIVLERYVAKPAFLPLPNLGN